MYTRYPTGTLFTLGRETITLTDGDGMFLVRMKNKEEFERYQLVENSDKSDTRDFFINTPVKYEKEFIRFIRFCEDIGEGTKEYVVGIPDRDYEIISLAVFHKLTKQFKDLEVSLNEYQKSIEDLGNFQISILDMNFWQRLKFALFGSLPTPIKS